MLLGQRQAHAAPLDLERLGLAGKQRSDRELRIAGVDDARKIFRRNDALGLERLHRQ